MYGAGLRLMAVCHTLRHSFATHLIEAGYEIRTVPELLGHRDVRTRMVYTHELNRGGRGVKSLMDALGAMSLRIRRKSSNTTRAYQKIAKTVTTKNLTINPRRRLRPTGDGVGVLCGKPYKINLLCLPGSREKL